MKIVRYILTILCVIFSTLCCTAGTDTAVYLINFYPGSEVYELEGHTAIGVIETPENGLPAVIAYHYGVYDFNSPNFLYRFVKGETDYMAAAAPLDAMIYAYKAENRRIVAHRLDLDSVQTLRLTEYLKDNIRPENRTYRYNYVLDNCATRPLRAIETATEDSILFSDLDPARTPTFRTMMEGYHRNYPWYQFGIDLALGSLIDRPLTVREETFAPVRLDSLISTATISGRPLVSQTLILNDVPADAAVDEATPWYLSPLTVCWAFFILTLILTVRDLRRRKISRWFDSFYFSLLTLAGLLLTFLIFISSHYATSPNYLYLWLNPFCGIMAIGIWIKRAKNIVFWYQICNFVVLTGLLILWGFIPQRVNSSFFPLIGAEMLRSLSYIILTKKDLRK